MMIRQSNIELLRWLSMLMITVFHINEHSLAYCEGFFSAEGILWHITNTLTVSATSIFVLISGYFGIKFKLKGVLNLYLRCAIWGIFGYVLLCLCVPSGSFEVSKLVGRLMPFTHGKWWFIVTYLELYFLSPILNAAIEMFDKRKHMIVILIFGFVTMYMGYCHETGEDTWGTSLSHFLWLYMIARYINRYVSLETIRKRRWWWFVGFFIASAITFGLAALESQVSVPVCLRAYPYCSPWVLCGAISALLFALSFTFESKMVNWFASSSLSGYLLQGHLYFAFAFLYPTLSAWMMGMSISIRYVLLLPISILLLIVTCLVDKVMEFCTYNPIIKLYDKLKIQEPIV